MENRCAMALEPIAGIGMLLHTCWWVNERETYQIYPRRADEPLLVAIRTLAGAGRVEVDGLPPMLATADTLLIVELRRLRHYGTHEANWQFHWYEFSRDSGVGLPWDTLLPVASNAWEVETAQRLFAFLARPEPAARAAASALFAALLHAWAAHAGGNPSIRPQFALVMRAVRRLHADPAAPLSVEALAQECGVSARWLRQAFARVLGCSPKHYQSNLRLTQAAAALRMGVGTVAQLAERFGYASPFHFSRAIKAKFGCPPTQLRDGRKGKE